MSDETLLLDRLLAEAARRESLEDPHRLDKKAEAILRQLMPMQRELALDPHRRIGLLTPGRVGKTYAVRARLFRRALMQRDSLSVYIGLTRQKAEQEIWNGPSGIVTLCDKLDLREPEVRFDRHKLLFSFPRLGSQIMCGGVDDMRAVETYRGGPGYDEVWIDEAKSHPKDLLRVLMDDVLVPRINARYGVLGLCGTPGNILDTKFYEITRQGSPESIPFGQPHAPDDFKWSMHRWSLAMNTTKVPGTDLSIWELALKEKRDRGYTDQTPTWMREYLGLWAAEDTDFVYRYRPYTDDGAEFNVWTPKEATSDNPFGLPLTAHLEGGDARIAWHFAIGVDLGSVDPCAIEVLAFAPQTKRLYHVHEWYRQTLDVDVLADALVDAITKVQKYVDYPAAIVGDTAHMGATILEQIKTKTGHRVNPAVKTDKLGFVALANDDLVDGRMKVRKGSVLAEQLASLQWDDKGRRENPAQRNDACDALIYARGAITKFISHSKPLADVVRTPEQEMLDGILRGKARAEAARVAGGEPFIPGSGYRPGS